MPKSNGWVLIDTSAWIHALRPGGRQPIQEQVKEILSQGRAATCEMVILELLHGTRTEAEYANLSDGLSALRLFPITDAVWKQAYRLAHALRRKGLSVPAADRLIASVARIYDCRILHCDKHFDLITTHLARSLD